MPRTQSSELMNKEILPAILTRRTQPLLQNSVVKSNGGSAATKRVMVKQHSTTSQQSTSSAASSVQSAPDAFGGKSQSPGHTTAPELAAIAQNYPWYGSYLPIKPTTPSGMTNSGLPLECGLPHNQSTTSALMLEEKNGLIDCSKHNSETQLNTIYSNSDKLPTNGGSNTHKKRRRGLRFSFGSKKSSKNQDNVNRLPEKT